jgi:hypothetical protein
MSHRTHQGLTAASCLRWIAAAAAAALSCASTAAAEDFYAGRQITYIVGAGVGGGYDLQARVTARHLPKHIPGNPTIVVQNMPARIAAANHMFTTAPKDGTIALIQRGMLLAADLPLRHLVRDREVQLARQPQQRGCDVAGAPPAQDAYDLFDKERSSAVSQGRSETTKLYSRVSAPSQGGHRLQQHRVDRAAIERGEVQGIADWSCRRQGGTASLAARQERDA